MTNTNENITISQEVLVKVAGRIIPALIEEILSDGWMVKSIASGKIFKTQKLHEQPATAQPANEVAAQESQPEAEQSVTEAAPELQPATEAAEQPEAPAAEPAPGAPCARKMSLLDAAIEVIKADARPMNTREMVKQAIERGLWIQTACKTPEQSLYGAIFREIKEAEHARIRKSEKRGLFEYAL